MGFDINQKHKKKTNRASSDLMDKIIQNRHRKKGWEGRGEEFSPHLPHFRFFLFITGWNYSKLIFYFYF